MVLIRRIQANPFAAQYIRRYARPGKQRELALLALLFSAFLLALNALMPPPSGRALTRLYVLYYTVGRLTAPFAWRLFDSAGGFATTLALAVLIPMAAAVYTAIPVSRHAGTASLQELRVTPLSERSIVQAYVWMGFIRMPIVNALTIGLCISLLVHFSSNALLFPSDQLFHLLFVLLRAITVLEILVRLWLAVTIGVALALWLRRSPFLAGLSAMGLMLTISAAIMAGQSIVRAVLQFPWVGLLSHLSRYNVKGTLVFDILNVVAWVGVAAGLAAISTRWAKRGINLEWLA